ncbi:hypothetical protein AB7942_23925 [Neobacillus sp. BF23-41]|uniref:hypothetical protein n=1 Tax=Neobacillus sp. BF23-41 TaxID=3240280 RepID=UPI0034E408D5
MGAIIFTFIILLCIAVVIMYLLVTLIKWRSNLARKIEIIGYTILIASILWTAVANMTNDMSTGSDYLILDEKLNALWFLEDKKIAYIKDGDIGSLQEQHDRWYNDLVDLEVSSEYVKKQEEIAKIISYGLFVLSTLFISAGRIGELFVTNSNEEEVNKRKSRYRSRFKGRRRLK